MFSEITDGQFHIKTSGTSWLQAVLIIAKKNAKLFTELYKLSLDNLEESNKAYNIPINVDNLPPTPPEDLLTFLSQPDVRKLLHISYGILLEQRKDSIFEVLRANEEEHYLCVSRNIEHHLKLLF